MKKRAIAAVLAVAAFAAPAIAAPSCQDLRAAVPQFAEVGPLATRMDRAREAFKTAFDANLMAESRRYAIEWRSAAVEAIGAMKALRLAIVGNPECFANAQTALAGIDGMLAKWDAALKFAATIK